MYTHRLVNETNLTPTIDLEFFLSIERPDTLIHVNLLFYSVFDVFFNICIFIPAFTCHFLLGVNFYIKNLIINEVKYSKKEVMIFLSPQLGCKKL